MEHGVYRLRSRRKKHRCSKKRIVIAREVTQRDKQHKTPPLIYTLLLMLLADKSEYSNEVMQGKRETRR